MKNKWAEEEEKKKSVEDFIKLIGKPMDIDEARAMPKPKQQSGTTMPAMFDSFAVDGLAKALEEAREMAIAEHNRRVTEGHRLNRQQETFRYLVEQLSFYDLSNIDDAFATAYTDGILLEWICKGEFFSQLLDWKWLKTQSIQETAWFFAEYLKTEAFRD